MARLSLAAVLDGVAVLPLPAAALPGVKLRALEVDEGSLCWLDAEGGT